MSAMWIIILAAVVTAPIVLVAVWFWRRTNDYSAVLARFRQESEALWAEVIVPQTVFISYRRTDARTVAHRLAEALREKHGLRVFIDESAIKGGEPIWPAIQEALRHADAVFFVIDKDWEATMPQQGTNWVLREIMLTLSNGILAVPVLVDGRRIPQPDALPPEARPLLDKAGLPLDTGGNFHDDAARLAKCVSTAQGDLPQKRREKVMRLDQASIEPLARQMARVAQGMTLLAAFTVVVSFCMTFVAWEMHDLDENASHRMKNLEDGTNGRMEVVERDLKSQKDSNESALRAAGKARDEVTAMMADVGAQKFGFTFSLKEIDNKKVYGAIDWNTPRRVVVDGFAHTFENAKLTLRPFKDNSGAVILDLKLPDTAPEERRSLCKQLADEKKYVRAVAITRARSVNRITGDLVLVFPLD